MSPIMMRFWMPCFLSCKSKSVLAKPLEHQCSLATISPASLRGAIVDCGWLLRFRMVTDMNKPPIRVLVAEDHPIVADGIVAILAKAKDMLIVGLARDGGEAIELLKQHQPDILLLDLRMPVVDGIQVMRWIKGSGLTARTIILTGF